MDDSPHELRIREMTPTDCRPVAEIRVAGWQTAYAGLLPQSYLDAMRVTEDAERRRELLSKPGNPVVNLVAERAGEIIGWAAYGPYRDGEVRTEDAELYALYVRPGHWGGGVGEALLRTSTARCEAAGHGRVLLWVLKENARARRFYERHGFTPDGAVEPFEVDGVEVPEVRYARQR
ncbi:GNAT family N-acetyltransferase [Streptomyces sp. DSM 3412]|uniref:GNAT family N-acetyltransferase n=1 Tax=Streptomyces gottesmaniae TaxID=3075518 RepID=A0ABU2YR68_9ACTN|nr:GNAT family N-acetyltransferase [Streptomyces sp. DSM 3412]MDT0566795.1 GNAT family N-acetyltransferase [Streptomyces sp. DSM 3412]